MKLVLTSEGFYTKEIAEKTAELAGKPLAKLNVAIINEAYPVEFGDKRSIIRDLNSIDYYAGGEIDFINLLVLSHEEIEERIKLSDVIYVMGGHTDYLMKVYQNTGFDRLLKNRILEDKVYLGTSAGAMVAGRRAPTDINKALYYQGGEYGIEEYMGLVDFAVMPHAGSVEFPNNNPDNLNILCKGLDFDCYSLRDDQAIIVEDGKISFVGGEPFKVAGTSSSAGSK
jgi:dipeptidase E